MQRLKAIQKEFCSAGWIYTTHGTLVKKRWTNWSNWPNWSIRYHISVYFIYLLFIPRLSELLRLYSTEWINNQLDAEDDLFIGISTCFGHHHAHHQEDGTKPTTPMVYSTGRAAVNSWRRGGSVCTQHVSGIIMPIIRRMVQNRQRLWCTALAVLQ
jgi:hypothetical protein